MKALFTNTIWAGVSAARWPHSDCMSAPPQDRYSPYPFWLSIATALAKKEGHEAKMVNPYAEYLDEAKYYRFVKRFAPDVTVIESSTRTYNLDAEIAKKIKDETGSKVILVGTMPTAVPEKVLAQKEVDFIVRGEYEFAVAEIMKALSGRKTFSEIKGIDYMENGAIKQTEDRPLCNLNDLPFPNWEDDNLWLYHDGFIRHYPGLQIHASRGCMFKCPYCQWNQLMYREKYRMFSNEYVINMINYALDCFPACRELYFDDDNFTQRPQEEMIDFCKRIIAEGWNLPFSTMGHAGTVTDKSLEWMRKAGLYACKWGLETHDQQILNNLRKGLNIEKFGKTIKTSSDLDIINHVTVMFGLPGQDYKSCLSTIDYVIDLYHKHLIDTVQFSIATPFLGTRFYDQAIREGWIVNDNLEKFDGKNTTVLKYPDISSDEIEMAFNTGVKRMWNARARRFLKSNITKPKEIIVKLAREIERRQRG